MLCLPAASTAPQGRPACPQTQAPSCSQQQAGKTWGWQDMGMAGWPASEWVLGGGLRATGSHSTNLHTYLVDCPISAIPCTPSHAHHPMRTTPCAPPTWQWLASPALPPPRLPAAPASGQHWTTQTRLHPGGGWWSGHIGIRSPAGSPLPQPGSSLVPGATRLNPSKVRRESGGGVRRVAAQNAPPHRNASELAALVLGQHNSTAKVQGRTPQRHTQPQAHPGWSGSCRGC